LNKKTDNQFFQIIKEYLAGCTVSDINGNVIIFNDAEGCEIQLKISQKKCVLIKSIGPNMIQRDTIYTKSENPIIYSVNLDFRPKGVIVTELEKIYGKTVYSEDEKYVTDLNSRRSVFCSNEIRDILKKNCFDVNFCFDKINSKVAKNGKISPDFATEFSSRMLHVYVDKDNNCVNLEDNKYSTSTFLNGKDISCIYDGIDGCDKILRVYDLYMSKENLRTSVDIKNIISGSVPTEAFGLISTCGIVETENDLVGKSVNVQLNDYFSSVVNLIQSNIKEQDSKILKKVK
jgi:hypothetical protein